MMRRSHRPRRIIPLSQIVTCVVVSLVPPAAAHDQVQISLIGTIERSCSLSGALATVDLGDVTKISRRDLSLGVSCNTPFEYTLISANGGLRHNGNVNRIGGFTDLLPYRVNVSVPTDTGNARFSCASDQMTADARHCAAVDSGSGIALGQMAALSLSWQSPALPLLAGHFEDALTISFSVKP